MDDGWHMPNTGTRIKYAGQAGSILRRHTVGTGAGDRRPGQGEVVRGQVGGRRAGACTPSRGAHSVCVMNWVAHPHPVLSASLPPH